MCDDERLQYFVGTMIERSHGYHCAKGKKKKGNDACGGNKEKKTNVVKNSSTHIQE